MPILFATRVSVSDGILISQVGDESVILNLNSERYFGLDAVGARMWTAIINTETVQGAYERLLNEYEVDAEVLQRDLLNLLVSLREHGLVEFSSD